ncbi:tail fiber assembly protein [Pseudomonas phage PaSzW-1]|uniref:Phage tail assembly chaperone-like domain-containing protein n=3 Tax=Pakpunavirus TaxID=1921407 RepID=A0A410T8J6_9CAUD|nr:tail fiber assembly [Pseudomonas phage C11]YP_009224768.1 tail fiber assembly [Pseudomonas phage PaoP5]YP_010762022.1 hypothetical protein QE322_gp072 [Pseudomonas phage PaGz-1]YP_010762749.1 hypothetical protein QE326_gp074 [Pseudomonas phage PaZq-1]YP_010762966.1 hypothetical protein QE327_gp122 [Pseudomonas phage Henu5]AXY86933.1 putative tail fiber assembly protein [Pseudomonas phage PaYy-2]QAY01705.1 tail fiber assembly protein [Pseudomonas phage PaSzW-1]ALJ97534.1 hypothetical prote
MEFRNVVKIKAGFECEINHPEFGWIPYGAVEGCPTSHSMYVRIAKAVEDGSTGVVEEEAKYDTFEARLWRDNELIRADRQVEIAIDDEDEVREKAWRKYRSALRKWPEHKNFPSEKSKPKAPKE